MTVGYWRCGMCGVQLMTSDQTNVGRFPATRRFEDEREGAMALNQETILNLVRTYILNSTRRTSPRGSTFGTRRRMVSTQNTQKIRLRC
jgi:hypothetical protein